jgi:hypothetical protein
MQITFTLDDAKVPQFTAGFLRAYPKPGDVLLTDLQWVKQRIRRQVNEMYNVGARELHYEANPFDDSDILED